MLIVNGAKIGDTIENMLSLANVERIERLYKEFDLSAILLSAGGNDMVDHFARLARTLPKSGVNIRTKSFMRSMGKGEELKPVLDLIEMKLREFIYLRDSAPRQSVRNAPILLHGYDYMQPRNAKSRIIGSVRLKGPWFYPSLVKLGYADDEMLSIGKMVIDTLNQRLISVARDPGLKNLWFIDQRGLLTIAQPHTSKKSGDWDDEIHLTRSGIRKTTNAFWTPVLARALKLA